MTIVAIVTGVELPWEGKRSQSCYCTLESDEQAVDIEDCQEMSRRLVGELEWDDILKRGASPKIMATQWSHLVRINGTSD